MAIWSEEAFLGGSKVERNPQGSSGKLVVGRGIVKSKDRRKGL